MTTYTSGNFFFFGEGHTFSPLAEDQAVFHLSVKALKSPTFESHFQLLELFCVKMTSQRSNLVVTVCLR